METVQIERMGYGPWAVAHLSNGKTVFVDRAAPGDEAQIEVFDEKPRFAFAHICCLNKASDLRSSLSDDDATALFAEGGMWGHLSYPFQLKAKRDNVITALVRLGKMTEKRAENLVEECIPSKHEFSYRNKVEFAANHGSNGKFDLGFTLPQSHTIIFPKRCMLAHPEVAQAAKSLRGAIRYLEGTSKLDIFRVGLRHSTRCKSLELALWTKPGAFPHKAAATTLSAALPATSIVRVISAPGKARKVKKLETIFGKGYWEEELLGMHYKVSAPSFFQVNTEQAEELIRLVSSYIDVSHLSSAHIADLYAGGGTFTLPLAQLGAQVSAIESASSSVQDLRRNAANANADIDVIGGDAARELTRLGNLDALVVDPPRAGLAPNLPRDISQAGPERVVYVSCDPTSLARDLNRFETCGYKIEKVQPVDLFPQTYHVETVVLISRA
ncbi:MAG: 23S rRNA (uracil(1939)-C(5))-methyltransferase RlmD [Eggerthellaceae bacterium]|jgi:23S rRNA (uracil1939-C5)-methyltransferase